MLSAADPGLRRVSVNAGDAVVDLVLPRAARRGADPEIVDIVDGLAAIGSAIRRLSATSFPAGRVCSAGVGDVGAERIQDGAILVLSQPTTPVPDPRYDDVADAVSAAVDAKARPGPASGTAHRAVPQAALPALVPGADAQCIEQ